MKKITLVSVFLFLTSLSFIVYKNKHTEEIETETSSQIEQKTEYVILLGENSKYNTLNATEKTIVDSYLKKYPLNESEGSKEDAVTLRYYNDKIAVISRMDVKGGNYVRVYDLQIFSTTDNAVSLETFEGGYESAYYMIEVTDYGIKYYKAGDTEIKIIPNSANIVDSKNTPNLTYVKKGGYIKYYDFSFDESTKRLQVTTFNPIFKEGVDNPRLGSVDFILN